MKSTITDIVLDTISTQIWETLTLSLVEEVVKVDQKW